MNTPLGVQGLKHQQQRDKHEATFRRRYGVDTASSPEARVKATKAVQEGMKEVSRISAAKDRINKIFTASGRNPVFA